jgi:uncharacterized hydrophobic protein (TIGR00271 family)
MIQGFIKKLTSYKLRRMSREERMETCEKIRQLSNPSPSFYFMVCVSTVIATYGLLANSTAVVIGAMLVAPLMGPIFGIALGLSSGNNRLLRESVLAETLGVIICVSLAALIGLVPLHPHFASEIMARTQPTIYDLIIALASGFAGAYSMVNNKLSPALPGVAISTALVPPLATCGLCIAAHNWEYALGAFLLFLANLVAIELASAVVFALSGMVRITKEKGVLLIAFLRRFGISLLVLTAVAVFMTHTLIQIIHEQILVEELRTVLSGEIQSTIGARLSEIRYEKQGESLQVMAVVLTPQEFKAQRVADIEKVLQEEVDPDSRLIIRSLLSRDADSKGQVFITEEELVHQARQIQENEVLGQISRTLNEEISKLPGTSLADIHNILENGQRDITAIVHTPTPINPLQVSELEKSLNQVLDTPVHLVVRSLLTRDANTQRYLFNEDEELQEPLSGSAFEFHEKLETSIINLLQEQEPAARLLEFYYGEKYDYLLVLLQIRAPYIIEPEQVADLENALQEQVDDRIKLIVRSTVGVDASADYYLAGYDENLARALSP